MCAARPWAGRSIPESVEDEQRIFRMMSRKGAIRLQPSCGVVGPEDRARAHVDGRARCLTTTTHRRPLVLAIAAFRHWPSASLSCRRAIPLLRGYDDFGLAVGDAAGAQTCQLKAR